MFTKEEDQKIFSELRAMHPNAGCELNFGSVYELLVAVILSAQCTDKRVNEVTEKLFRVYNTPEQIAALSVEDLKPYIFSCGFYNNKGNNIIKMSRELVEKYNGEVPRDFDKLVSLAGVGRKTASVVMCVGFDEPAMPVDTHVNRVSKRIGLSDGNDVEKVEQDLKDQFSPETWNALHHSLIFHGRYICHSRKPDCAACSLRPWCRYYKEEQKG